MLTIESCATRVPIEELAEALHPDDAAELAAGRTDLRTALADAHLQALRWNGRLVALFGCEPANAGSGIPWMLCTTTLADVPRRQMAAISEQVVEDWRGRFACLGNMVHRHNDRALRFVRWLGFTIHPETIGPDGEFFLFEWRRDV